MLKRIRKESGAVKKIVLSLLLLFTIALFDVAEAALRVSLLLGGSTADKGFNQLCMEGLENVKNRYRRRLVTRSVQAQDAGVLGLSLFDKIAAESDLVIVADYRYLDALRSAARKYPDVKFAVLDGSGGIPGVKDVVFREEEGGFLAGVLAAILTQRHDLERINEDAAVGILIGAEIPATQRFLYGYRRGVAHISPFMRVEHAVVGDFDDVGKGRELALSLRNRGADVIFTAAGKAGLGAIESAVSGGYWVIGVDAEQEAFNPEAVLTSVIKNSGVAVYKIIESCMDDTWDERTLSLGIKEGAISLSIWTREAKRRIPVDIRNKLDVIEKNIQLGTIEVN